MYIYVILSEKTLLCDHLVPKCLTLYSSWSKMLKSPAEPRTSVNNNINNITWASMIQLIATSLLLFVINVKDITKLYDFFNYLHCETTSLGCCFGHVPLNNQWFSWLNGATIYYHSSYNYTNKYGITYGKAHTLTVMQIHTSHFIVIHTLQCLLSWHFILKPIPCIQFKLRMCKVTCILVSAIMSMSA